MNYELLGILLTVVIQAICVVYKLGQMTEKLVELEHKQDKHNNLIERMYKVESDVQTAHTRIDYLEGKE